MQPDLQNLFHDSSKGMLDDVLSRLNDEERLLLTDQEKDISVLLWLNFDHYEIAQLLNMELADIELERERIREKLALSGEQTIQQFIQTNLA